MYAAIREAKFFEFLRGFSKMELGPFPDASRACIHSHSESYIQRSWTLPANEATTTTTTTTAVTYVQICDDSNVSRHRARKTIKGNVFEEMVSDLITASQLWQNRCGTIKWWIPQFNFVICLVRLKLVKSV